VPCLSTNEFNRTGTVPYRKIVEMPFLRSAKQESIQIFSGENLSIRLCKRRKHYNKTKSFYNLQRSI